MISFNDLFKEFIDQLESATTSEALNINRSKLRTKTINTAINYLRLSENEKDLWIQVYESGIKQLEIDKQSAKIAGVSDSSVVADISLLEKRNRIALGAEGATFEQIDWFRDALNRPSGEYQIGHNNVSIALVRAKLLLEYSKRLGTDEKFTAGKLTPFQVDKIKRIIKVFQKIESLDLSEIQKITESNSGKVNNAALLAIVDTTTNIEISAKLDKLLSGDKAKLQFSVSFEVEEQNQAKGNLARLLGIQLAKVLKANITKTEKALSKDAFLSKLTTVQSSPSFIDNIDASIAAAIFGKKIRKTTRSTKTKVFKTKRDPRIKGSIARYNKKKIKRIPKVTAPRIPDENLFSIKNAINQILAETVREAMGSSTDPAIKLRNQTGRFSESAKLLTLNRSQTKTLVGTYTYQRTPYDTFLPGGSLHTLQRDPRIYVEGAIRGISMSILKSRFNGLSLELE